MQEQPAARIRPDQFDFGELTFCDEPGWLPPTPPDEDGWPYQDRWSDPDTSPPDGEDAWLADLASDQLDELAAELAAARPPAAREAVGAGFTHRAAAAGIAAGELGWEPRYAGPQAARPAAGFAAGRPLDALDAGIVLAQFASEVAGPGLAGLSDDELVGLLCASRRLASWQAAAELTAAAELDARRRRDAAVMKGAAGESSAVSERVAAELAAALTLTGRTADSLLGLARDLARLPAVMAALAAGRIDLAKARVFAAELAPLGDVTACQIAARLLDRASAWTTSELRRALRSAVLAADPEAGKRRAEQGRTQSRVEAWQEGSGNGALAGRELPAADAIAADARIGRLARALKANGAAGTLDQLRAAVFLALLLGKDPERLLDAEPAPVGGIVHLTLPALTWLGLADRPGDLAGLGPIDAHTGRDLAAMLAEAGTATWHVTLTDQQGQAVAHACARGQPVVPRATGPPGATGPPLATDPRRRWLTGLTFEWLERGECQHPRQTTAYQPGARLRHLLAVRNPTCTAPGCRRPAAACDNEHTVPFDQGGRTCECNCGPVCRRHHRIKQAPGWHVAQPSPGVVVWTTPAGRTYTTHPGIYPR